MNLKIDERVISKLLIFEIYYIFFNQALIDFLGFPSFITYAIDLINILVIVYFFYSNKRKKIFSYLQLNALYTWFFLLILYMVFSALINLSNPLLMLWGMRNTLRYFPFFFALIVFLTRKEMEKIINFLIWFQIPNFLIVLYQCYHLGYFQDLLGGIFGNTVGCNGYVNMYMCIAVSIVTIRYLKKKLSFYLLIYSIVSWMLIAGLTELKVAFIELPLIIIIAVIFNKFSFRSIFIITTIIFAIIMGVSIIIEYFPRWAYAFVNINSLMSVGTETGGGYNISRITAFADINNIFFKDSIFLNMFGYGIGNCEYSSFEFLTSNFYKMYGGYNYRWFSHQMWFLQCGYLGILCLVVFILLYLDKLSEFKKKYEDKEGYMSFGQILAILLVINFIYNSSLITEIGYLLFFAMSIPLIHMKEYLIKNRRKYRKRILIKNNKNLERK